MTCDLIVGSGWPFGAEFLTGDERADVVVNYSEKLSGPIDYEVSRDGLFCAADPAISSPFLGKKMELVSLQLVPEPFGSLDQAIDPVSYTHLDVYKRQVTLSRLSTKENPVLVQRTRKYGYRFPAATNELKDAGPNIQDYQWQYPIPLQVIEANSGANFPQNEGY